MTAVYGTIGLHIHPWLTEKDLIAFVPGLNSSFDIQT
jgi:hypothetical protein